MKIDEIKTIVQLMSDHDLTEFKIEAEEMHLCIRRGMTGHNSSFMPQQPQPLSIPQQGPTAVPQDEKNGKKNEDVVSDRPVKKETIDAPIVGTFYRAPSPDAEPFVKIGAAVSSETVVCVIEAMKVMNEIKAEKSGVIKEILVENSNPVEFGQPLFVIE